MSRLGVPRGIRAGGPRLRASNRKTSWRPDSNPQSSGTNLQSPISLPDPQFGRWSVRVLKPATLTFAQGDLASRDAVVKTRGMYRHRHRGRGLAGLALGLVILGLGHMRLVRVAHTHEAPPARRQASATAEMASDRVAARAEANRLAAEEAAAAAAKDGTAPFVRNSLIHVSNPSRIEEDGGRLGPRAAARSSPRLPRASTSPGGSPRRHTESS